MPDDSPFQELRKLVVQKKVSTSPLSALSQAFSAEMQSLNDLFKDNEGSLKEDGVHALQEAVKGAGVEAFANIHRFLSGKPELITPERLSTYEEHMTKVHGMKMPRQTSKSAHIVPDSPLDNFRGDLVKGKISTAFLNLVANNHGSMSDLNVLFHEGNLTPNGTKALIGATYLSFVAIQRKLEKYPGVISPPNLSCLTNAMQERQHHAELSPQELGADSQDVDREEVASIASSIDAEDRSTLDHNDSKNGIYLRQHPRTHDWQIRTFDDKPIIDGEIHWNPSSETHSVFAGANADVYLGKAESRNVPSDAGITIRKLGIRDNSTQWLTVEKAREACRPLSNQRSSESKGR